MRRLSLIFCLILVLLLQAANAGDGVISTSVKGSATMPADRVIMEFYVFTYAEDASKAETLLTHRINDFYRSFDLATIDTSIAPVNTYTVSIGLGNVSIVHCGGPNNAGGEDPDGFMFRRNLSVKIDHLRYADQSLVRKEIAKLLQRFMDAACITNHVDCSNFTVVYEVEDQSLLVSRAHLDAINKAKARAIVIANAAGRKLGKVSMIKESRLDLSNTNIVEASVTLDIEFEMVD